MENNNQAKIKKQSIFLQKIKNSKKLKSNFKRYVGRLTKRDISKKMKKFFMKTNQLGKEILFFNLIIIEKQNQK